MSGPKEKYDQLYTAQENVYNEGRPDPAVEEIPNMRSGGSVFEIGAGQGRNALFLASKGFDVTALELSSVGVETIRQRAAERGLSVKVIEGDIREVPFEKSYDIFVCTFVFHHLPDGVGREMLKAIQERTERGGLNAIAAIT